MKRLLLDFFISIGTSVRWYLGRVGFHSALASHLKRLDRLLVLAGEPWGFTGTAVLGVQFIAMLFLPILFGAVLYFSTLFPYLFEGPKQIILYSMLVVVGFGFPVFNLKERAAERQRQIALDLPDTLDLLTISVEAGLDLISALRRVVEKHRPGYLKFELERFFKQLEFGRPRRDALRELADRVEISDMNSVVSGLIQAEKLGSSLGPVLRAQSDSLRTRRSQRAEKAAQEAPVKMLAPLMVCILPSVFLMILGPIIIQMVKDFSQ